jgi:hypothetical protein
LPKRLRWSASIDSGGRIRTRDLRVMSRGRFWRKPGDSCRPPLRRPSPLRRDGRPARSAGWSGR